MNKDQDVADTSKVCLLRVAGSSSDGTIIFTLRTKQYGDARLVGQMKRGNSSSWLSNNVRVFTPATLNFSRGIITFVEEKKSVRVSKLYSTSKSARSILKM